MPVDITKIAVGDKVNAEFVVGAVYGDHLRVGPLSDPNYYTIWASSLISHTPKPPEIPVGTMFGWAGRRYKILFVDDHGIAYRGINTRDTCAMAFSEFHKGLLSGLYKII